MGDLASMGIVTGVHDGEPVQPVEANSGNQPSTEDFP